MADWDDVRNAVAPLPLVSEIDGNTLTWKVGQKSFLWERPLRKYEVAELGSDMRDAPILGAIIASIGDREGLIAETRDVFFTTSHFEGYPAVLIWLDRISPQLLAEVAVEAWLARAPSRVTKEFLRGEPIISDNLDKS